MLRRERKTKANGNEKFATASKRTHLICLTKAINV